MSENLILEAIRYAKLCHAGQKRKYSSDPYIFHPARVAGLVATTRICDECTISAAWLHDVIEDCGRSAPNDLLPRFGITVASLVDDLTDRSDGTGKIRAERKQMERERLQGVSVKAKVIKLCDRLDNIRDMVTCDSPKFARLYVQETTLLIEAIGNADKDITQAIRESYNALVHRMDLACEALEKRP